MIKNNFKEGFKYGVNFGSNNLGKDIGGKDLLGFDKNKKSIRKILKDISRNNGDIVKVSLFPNLRSDAIAFGENDCIVDLSESARKDIEAFSKIALQNNLKIIWVINSFISNFKIDDAPVIKRYISDSSCKESYMRNLIFKCIRYISLDPSYEKTFHSYDLFDKPEYIMSGSNPHDSSNSFSSYMTSRMDISNSVNFNDMKSFLTELALYVRATDPSACITIGSASKPWSWLWQSIVDYNSPHTSSALENHYPSTDYPSAYGLTKPSMIGSIESNMLEKSDVDFIYEYIDSGYFAVMSESYESFTNSSEEINNLIAMDVKKGRYIEIDQRSIDCGETKEITFKTLSNISQHVPIDPSTLTTNVGLITNVKYNKEALNYSATVEMPSDCQSVSFNIDAKSLSGDIMSGATLVNMEGCNDGLPCQFVVGSCIQGDDCTFTLGSGESCNFPDNGCKVNVRCECKATAILLSGNDPKCPKLGDVFQWKINGCGCFGECGDPVVTHTGGANSSTICYFEEDKILQIGPVVDCSSIVFSLSCEKEDPCVRLVEDPTCYNYVGTTRVGDDIALMVRPNDVAFESTVIESFQSNANTDSSVIDVFSVNPNLIMNPKKAGTSSLTLRLRTATGGYFYCDVNFIVTE